MEIDFGTKKFAKVMNSDAEMKRTYGDRMARTIQMRLAVLRAARNLAEVPTTPPCVRHQLSQDRDEQFAVNLVQPHRLLFVVANDPVPRKEDGGIDLGAVTEVTITEIVDYH